MFHNGCLAICYRTDDTDLAFTAEVNDDLTTEWELGSIEVSSPAIDASTTDVLERDNTPGNGVARRSMRLTVRLAD